MIQEEININFIEDKEYTSLPYEDRRLSDDIFRYGLEQPLLVEGPVDGKFILVDGFKRLASLKSLNWDTVPCIVESPTNTPTRISKRLRRDQHLKRISVSQRINYVHKLLDSHWDVDMIANMTDLSRQTVVNYSKIIWVPEDIKEIARNINLSENSEILLEQIAQRSSLETLRLIVNTLLAELPRVYKYHLQAIEQLSRLSIFNNLPRESIKRVALVAAKWSKFKEPNAQEILFKEAIISRKVRSKEVYEVSANYVLNDLTHLSRILNPHFMSYIDKNEANQIISTIEIILRNIKKPAGFRF